MYRSVSCLLGLVAKRERICLVGWRGLDCSYDDLTGWGVVHLLSKRSVGGDECTFFLLRQAREAVGGGLVYRQLDSRADVVDQHCLARWVPHAFVLESQDRGVERSGLAVFSVCGLR